MAVCRENRLLENVVRSRRNSAVTGQTSSKDYLILALSLLPPVLVGLLILKYGVDFIDWDQWEIAGFFAKVAQGSLSPADLFVQQAEYRQFFPNLIFISLGWITHWNIKYEMLVSLLLACLVAFNVYRLSQITVRGSRSGLLFLALVSNLLIFSPAQFENWLLGEQIIYFIPVVCLTTCLRVAHSQTNPLTKLILCMLLATISTFSSANGIICWLVVPPVLIFAYETQAKRLYYGVAWAIGLGLNFAGYLYGYHQPPYSPSLFAALHDPLRGLMFFLTLLGAPLVTSQRLMPAPIVVGAALAALFAAAWVYVFKFADNPELRRRALVWLMLGSYSILTITVVTLARFGMGMRQALASRYTTFSIYLLISLCYLVPLIVADLTSGARFAQRRLSIGRLVRFALAALLVLNLLNSAAAVRQAVWLKIRRLQAKGCLLFIDSVPDECLTNSKALPDLNMVKERVKAIDALDFLRPGLIKSNRIEDIANADTRAASSDGRFETLSRTGDSVLVAAGWASLPGRGQPADIVLLSYQKEQAAPVIFALAEMSFAQPSFTASLVKARAADWRWQKSFPLHRVPVAPPFSVSAWAFDATTGKAYKIDGSYLIENESGEVNFKDTGTP
jgi:hypothetical protein